MLELAGPALKKTAPGPGGGLERHGCPCPGDRHRQSRQNPGNRGLLSDLGLSPEPGGFSDCPEVAEDGDTFEANAAKAQEWRLHRTPGPGGRLRPGGGGPGRPARGLSARYAGPHGAGGPRTRKITGSCWRRWPACPGTQRRARFVCCMVVAFPEGGGRGPGGLRGRD